MKDRNEWSILTGSNPVAAAIGSGGTQAGAMESSIRWKRPSMTGTLGRIRVCRMALLVSTMLLIRVMPQAEAATTEQAMQWYRDARFEESRKGFEALLDQRPKDHRLAFNAGAAAYRQGDFEGAARHFERVLDSADLQLQQQAFYNLGVSQFRMGEAAKDPSQRRPQWEMARDNFAAATGLNPSDTAARSNLDRVMALLEQEPEQQPESQENQEGDDGKEGDESQKKDESGKGDESGQKDSSQKGDESGDSSEDQSGEQSGKDQEGKSGESGEDSKSGNEDGGMEQGGEKDGQAGKEGNDGPKALNPGKDDGKEGEGGSGSAESRTGTAEQEVPVRMTVQQAEQMLDEARGEEKALIWRPPSTGRESRTASGRRKTW